MDKQLRQRVSLKNPVHFLALGFGSGLIPFMPGTFGSLAALPLLIPFLYLPPITLLIAAVLASAIGIYLCGKTADDMQVHDHGSIVWDEVAGILLTFLWVPLSLWTVVAGFLLFRFFDIVKPWPIGPVDKYVSGGLGIMLDDIIAGLMACASLHGLIWIVNSAPNL
ncbi:MULTISPECIES: phosphatidylglycerophosphatase A [Marisediminitalea]|jgi:phosphatidylglycerophosphatase A|uniref:phosphatidylglycerophosphatase A family protein n=1 Tax=Marisediminitalea TaxID=2662254 RepID=UPI000C537825|nr:phosphatidylglycerophosphatase A [Marisediminitalea aggregata]MAP21593.1 phosphatidylglycerophosphatase A [Alteromonadaceae bacterium]MCP4238182.1 phosphatidylglycerophosphatase A [Aestuariibacter sp.]MAX44988.1 phosphatidylglycerophosphatase A [Alteromonadaceae bacterium]MCP5012505.1 phosphatidylglycerophosphatase A [Aestuariibacter sp.]MCP9478603.1 phosphatidylglycerophosphatase A [Marisediminitalea aggregata]|tara:strand:- start:52 stop:549 length:498 start_codon:yes stop_codon:yes gene_type:complete